MLKNRLFYLLFLAAMVVFHIFYGQWISFVLLILAAVMPLLSLAVSLPGMRSCSVELRVEGCTDRGGVCRVVPMIRGRFVPECRGVLRITHSITGENRPVRWRADAVPLRTEHCGTIRCVPEKMWAYDALGLFKMRVRRVDAGTVTILPEPAAVNPMPSLRRLLLPRFRPKPGGGYAENHELRLYRPGDDLRQMHWKLSAKVDDLILREPMVPEKGLTLLTADLTGTPDQVDQTMGRLLWMTRTLISRGIAHEIRCLTGAGIVVCRISSGDDCMGALVAILGKPPVQPGDSMARQTITAQWRYHVAAEEEGSA